MNDLVRRLFDSDEPSVRYKVALNLFDPPPSVAQIRELQAAIRNSPRTRSLLSQVSGSGTIPLHPYSKWAGAHWVLTMLGEIGYPANDRRLFPLREQAYSWLFSEHEESRIRVINGRVRRCATQEGNAVHYSLMLGLADARTDELALRLMKWQWPDGGWNCDKRPEAVNSSYHESLVPMRALGLYARLTGNKDARRSVERAAELFLKRQLFKKLRNGSVMSRDFVELCFPSYWHYDFLSALKVMAETGFIRDKRCGSALDLLESKRLPDGGFPVERKYYQTTRPNIPGYSNTSGYTPVNWGGISRRRMNEFITVDAFTVLKAAGRL